MVQNISSESQNLNNGSAELAAIPMVQNISSEKQDLNNGSAEFAQLKEKIILEKMADLKTWDAMKNAVLSLGGKTAKDLEISPDESLNFSKEKLPENTTTDNNQVIFKGIMK